MIFSFYLLQIKGKYDIHLEQEARVWIEEVLDLELQEVGIHSMSSG